MKTKLLIISLAVLAVVAASASWLRNPGFVASLNSTPVAGEVVYTTNSQTFTHNNWGSFEQFTVPSVGQVIGYEMILRGFASPNPSLLVFDSTDGTLNYVFPIAAGTGGAGAVSDITITLSSFSAYTGAFTNDGVYILNDANSLTNNKPTGGHNMIMAITAGTMTTTNWTVNTIYTP